MGWVVSHQMLQEWVSDLPASDQVAKALTMGGFEVDQVQIVEPVHEKVVVGRVLSTEQHPNADRLRVCQVDVGGDTPLNIVCGCASVKADIKVAVAQIGATLPGDFSIKKSKLRGVVSEGMLCSKSELGMAASSGGIWHIDMNDWQIGASLSQYLGCGDALYHVDVTPNRGDCLSHLGVAREVAMLMGLSMKTPWQVDAFTVAGKPIREVAIEAKEVCHHYCSAHLEGLDPNAKTPTWMVQRLANAGIASLGLVVDVTHYVMLEVGQPMHAFDADALMGDLSVRFAKEGESFEGLDLQTRALNAKHLVVADGNGVVGLAGVMGGEKSAVVADKTTCVVLESAAFNPAGMIRAVRDFHIHTEASNRFARGVDPALCAKAMMRAISLLEAHAGAKCTIRQEAFGKSWERKAIGVRPEHIERYLGMPVDKAVCEQHFKQLDCQFTWLDAGKWQVTPPSWRFDLAIEADFIEEHVRLMGYDQLPASGLQWDYCSDIGTELPLDVVRTALAAEGMDEIVSYSFVDPAFLEKWLGVKDPLMLANPMAPNMAAMRTSLLPGLLETAIHNVRRQQKQVRLFEVGHCFDKHGSAVVETQHIGLLLHGSQMPEQWGVSDHSMDFFDLKGAVSRVFASMMQVPFDQKGIFLPSKEPLACFHPKQVADMMYQDRLIGQVGVLHPRLMRSLGQEGVWLFAQLLDIASWLQPASIKYENHSIFPSIRRDLCIFLPDGIECEDVIRYIKSQTSSDLQKLIVFDDYRDQDEEGASRRSLAIGLIFQRKDRSLTDEEVSRTVDSWVEGLGKELSVSMR